MTRVKYHASYAHHVWTLCEIEFIGYPYVIVRTNESFDISKITCVLFVRY
jgi:hypothetical protein